MGKIGEQITVVLLAVIGVAIVAVVFSKSANTSGVLTAGGTAFSNILGAALKPVTSGTAL
jgi:PRD1 phage membrane DNA delivery